MADYRSIEIDIEVHKRIESARLSFDEEANEVLRRLLGIKSDAPVPKLVGTPAKGWHGKGVTLPDGTQLRMQYNGQRHFGEIRNGQWLVDGNAFTSPSSAAGGVARTKAGTKTSLDGWLYWEAMLPSSKTWVPISSMKK